MKLNTLPPKLLIINDISGVGRCSMSVSLPVVSACKVQGIPVPTSVFSNHTGFPTHLKIDLTGQLKDYFAALNIPFTKIASDDFVRIDIEYFLNIALNNSAVHKLLNRIYTSSFSFPSFGCCAKYVECSNAGHCLHTDILYASAACQYKHNLDAGRIFYATNKS